MYSSSFSFSQTTHNTTRPPTVLAGDFGLAQYDILKCLLKYRNGCQKETLMVRFGKWEALALRDMIGSQLAKTCKHYSPL